MQVVPNTGFTKWLTTFTAGAMSFLAVLGLAFSLICADLANSWANSLKNFLLYTHFGTNWSFKKANGHSSDYFGSN
jgi:hypothetical protein